MIKIKIADTQFAHGTSLGSGDLKIYPQFFEWYRGDENINDMVIITESMFHKTDQFTEKVKIAWLIEPISINSESYKFIENNWHKFDYILSHNIDFIKNLEAKAESDIKEGYVICPEKRPQISWYPFGGCWILPQDRKIYPKTKLISIIASDKKETEGHQLRHQAIAALGDKVDVYGRGYNPVEYKLDALKDYQYSIVIENEKTEGFFTEKLIDCFMTGTVPIYWGDPKINELLNEGMKIGPYHCCAMDFNTIDELIEIINSSNPPLTVPANWCGESLREFSFVRAQKYSCPEDWLWINFFRKNNLVNE